MQKKALNFFLHLIYYGTLFLCQILPFCTVLAFLLRRLYNVSHAKKRRIFPMSNVSIKLLREGAKLYFESVAYYDLLVK